MQARPGHDSRALSAPPLIPVDDLAGFLRGEWRVAKFGWDGVLGRAMRFAGRATFRADGDCLLFTEQGTLAFAGYRGDAGQRHRFAVTGAAADVWFEDGRFFHALDLRQGRAVVRHACAPDLYEGRYRVYGCDAWGVTWRVAGPRKRQVIASRFWRAR